MMYRYPTLTPIESSGVGVPREIEATTARGRLEKLIERDQHQGKTPWDVYITVNDYKQVMGVSHDTAYRWLERFVDCGILHHGISGDKMGYALKSKYASIADPKTNEYKSPKQIVETASDLLEAAENA